MWAPEKCHEWTHYLQPEIFHRVPDWFVHWLNGFQLNRVEYCKLCQYMHYVHTDRDRQYLTNCQQGFSIRKQIWHAWLSLDTDHYHTICLCSAVSEHAQIISCCYVSNDNYMCIVLCSLTQHTVLLRMRTEFRDHGFRFFGPGAWNGLPTELHYITDTELFKKRLKTVLFVHTYC